MAFVTEGQMNKAIRSQIALNTATSGYSVALTKTAFKAKILRGIFGKFYDETARISGSFKKLGKVLLNPVGTLVKMGKSIVGILSSFTMIIGVIGAVVAAFLLLSGGIGGNSESMEILREAFNKVKDAMGMVIEKIAEFDFGPSIDAAKIAVTLLGELIIFTLATVVVAVEKIVEFLMATFLPVWDALTGAIDGLGITSGGVFSAMSIGIGMLKTAFESAAIQGILDSIISYLKIILELYAVLMIAYIKLIAFVIGGLIDFVTTYKKEFGIMKDIFVGYIKFVIAYWTGLIDTVVLILTNIIAVIKGEKGITEAFWDIVSGIGDIFMEFVGKVADIISPLTDKLIGPFEAMKEKAMSIFDWIAGAIPSMPGWMTDLGGGALNAIGFASGGISSGPTSGYPVTLHGTEAVVPLPDGKTIPVSLQGGGGEGGGSPTINITMNGVTGNANDIAKAVSSEVQKAFKTRSRSSGYGRGI